MILRQALKKELTCFSRLVALTAALVVQAVSSSMVTAAPDDDPAAEPAKDTDDDPQLPLGLKTATLIARSEYGSRDPSSYLKATFSFRFPKRDNRMHAGNWDFEYARDAFFITRVAGDPSSMVDLGELTWSQVQLDALPKHPVAPPRQPKKRGVPAIVGHMYLVHSVYTTFEFDAVFRVERQAKDTCDITWKIIESQDRSGNSLGHNAGAIDEQSPNYEGLKTASLFSRSVYGSYPKATFSFEFATRDDVKLTRNDWDIEYTQGKFHVCTVRGDRSRIADLGKLTWSQVQLDALPKLPGRLQRRAPRLAAVVSHIYLVHTVDSESDFYTLFRVERQAKDICDITWKVIDLQDQPVRSPAQNR